MYNILYDPIIEVRPISHDAPEQHQWVNEVRVITYHYVSNVGRYDGKGYVKLPGYPTKLCVDKRIKINPDGIMITSLTWTLLLRNKMFMSIFLDGILYQKFVHFLTNNTTSNGLLNIANIPTDIKQKCRDFNWKNLMESGTIWRYGNGPENIKRINKRIEMIVKHFMASEYNTKNTKKHYMISSSQHVSFKDQQHVKQKQTYDKVMLCTNLTQYGAKCKRKVKNGQKLCFQHMKKYTKMSDE